MSGDKKNVNALKYGVMVEGVMGSRGEECVYRDRCPDSFSRVCQPCLLCPYESMLLEAYITCAEEQYRYALAWMTASRFRAVIVRLGVTELQLQRLSLRIACEATFEDVVLTDAERLLLGRYGTALSNLRGRLMAELIDDETKTTWWIR